MGDTLCSGLLYLCSCCCFCSNSDPGSDGSGFCSGSGKRSKDKDPRERALKQEFMQRGYHRDAVSGRIHVDQPAQSHLMMTAIGQPSRPSSEAAKNPSGEQPSNDHAPITSPPPSGDPP
ncbi:hypothetical protein MSAN_01541700 [Mycena sanguinolenta]|uniref:Uncharacterized protein n=1 Tax=Mycena sanguinolenta TaxID=230812 RepID=A0A8H6Y3L7_9AGAR|nr:hypothetical protein MSAN_01533500 [Mycena sanguinolenta]KAF7353520.1 hypothetical protein MSAN_01541700 [Mycena sanguinolenta]